MSIVGGIAGILVALSALTGFNPLGSMLGAKPTPSATTYSAVAPTEPVDTGEQTYDDPPVVPTTEAAEPTPTPPPDFTVASSQWDGPCDPGCGMTAIFHNWGGTAGTATATFYVMQDPDDNQYLAYCSVVIPDTPEGGATSTGCTAYSATLSWWFQSHRTVNMRVVVANP